METIVQNKNINPITRGIKKGKKSSGFDALTMERIAMAKNDNVSAKRNSPQNTDERRTILQSQVLHHRTDGHSFRILHML